MFEFPDKKYKCILADPPWRYDNKNTGGSMNSGPEQKYNTMSLTEIKRLPVLDIVMRDSCLFLWTTTPLLPEALEVMNAWRYKYITSIYWHKVGSFGMGFWFRGQVEVCLVAIMGDIKPFGCQKPNIIEAKPRGHSKKPLEMYAIIESLNINPKIELFARERREGWDAWGNQVSNYSQKVLDMESKTALITGITGQKN